MGKKRLDDAIQKIDFPVEIVYRCFELDPSTGRDVPYNVYESLSKKYGMSLDQAKASCRNTERMARDAGLEYHFDKVILTNTFDAHQLTLYAKKYGMMKEMTERLLRAYFTEGKHIGDHATLVQLAEEIGLDGPAVKEMLSGKEMSDAVYADEVQAQQYGIRSVPFFLINKKYSLTGAQPLETFVQALKQVMQQDGPFTNLGGQSGATCDDDGCEIPEK
ncbi:DsbA family oxidoreductase [Paenibacillus sp. BSR1-1]|uniref:DsbA family oxidoreductase n=1 Tax=Paenibacillus sp. BSR1-1 TaxID=3020845 RepID=UPI0025B05D14|nr:DsbA family oxidoreductase [Paenibacillus sp. BSR1-1]MDN3015529.1 DsbA family oxidoreductase [Paenibacillus sp. BSR1-1]